jgi:hypothetical protein
MAQHNDIHGEPIVHGILRAMQRYTWPAHLDDIIEFTGPFVYAIGKTPYISFTQYGVKEEGRAPYLDEETRCWTEAEALWRFRRAFIGYLEEHPARQLAWRSKPKVEQSQDGDYVVRCRFALLGEFVPTPEPVE